MLNLILTDPVDHTVQPAEWQAMLLEFIALLAGDAEVRLLHWNELFRIGIILYPNPKLIKRTVGKF